MPISLRGFQYIFHCILKTKFRATHLIRNLQLYSWVDKTLYPFSECLLNSSESPRSVPRFARSWMTTILAESALAGHWGKPPCRQPCPRPVIAIRTPRSSQEPAACSAEDCVARIRERASSQRSLWRWARLAGSAWSVGVRVDVFCRDSIEISSRYTFIISGSMVRLFGWSKSLIFIIGLIRAPLIGHADWFLGIGEIYLLTLRREMFSWGSWMSSSS